MTTWIFWFRTSMCFILFHCHNMAAQASSSKMKRATLSDFLSGYMSEIPFSGSWLSESHLLISRFDEWRILDTDSGKFTPLITKSSEISDVKDIKFSSDKKHVLIQGKSSSLYRRSSLSPYFVAKVDNYKIDFKTMKKLSGSTELLKYATWAPARDGIAYVDMNNNLYYRKGVYGKDHCLCCDGEADTVYCGVPDWVYEEEIFEDSHPMAVWWSTDGRKLAYVKFDDKEVETMELAYYGSWKNLTQYPEKRKIKYPKPGTRNPKITLNIVDLASNPPRRAVSRPPPDLDEPVFGRLAWLSESSFVVYWMNRIQNESSFATCTLTAKKVKCTQIYKKDQKNGWVNKDVDLTPYKGKVHKYKDSFLFINPDSSKEQYFQIFLIYGRKIKQITQDQADVVDILQWTADGTIYYSATGIKDRTSLHLYSIQLSSKKSKCITCQIRYRNDDCGYSNVIMSENGSKFVLSCLGPMIPYTAIFETKKIELLQVLEQNIHIIGYTRKHLGYSRKRLKIGKADAEIIMSFDVNMNTDKKYPALVVVYGGPGSQVVNQQWLDSSSFFLKYLVMAHNFIGILIDGRGTGLQGHAYATSVYRDLGKYEADDVISVTKTLTESFPIIDKRHVGIFGWSFGGYLSLSVLAKDTQDVFCCGVSVAPVTLWNLYDTFYTERYMSTPKDNPMGYNRSSPLWNIENLRKKKFLLAHGTLDDNVHIQQSMFLSQALEEEEILFQELVYPDQNHSIGEYLKHLFHSVTNFLLNAFEYKSPGEVNDEL